MRELICVSSCTVFMTRSHLVVAASAALSVCKNLLTSSAQNRLFVKENKYLLLAECEVRTASYGPSFFLPFKEGKNKDP